MKSLWGKCFIITIACLSASTLFSPYASAASSNGEFYLQVSPSPLTAKVKPGRTSTLSIKIRNAGNAPEKLRITPRSFHFDSKTQQVLLDNKQPDISSWMTLHDPIFTVQPGQIFTENVKLAVPESAGFSYYFAFIVDRVELPKQTQGRSLSGSVAVFALINVDRPGTIRRLELSEFTPSQDTYEALPVPLKVSVKNTGNTIAQVAGNVFIQRSGTDQNPIDTLDLNKEGGFILPGTTRVFSVNWERGFQVEKTTNVGGEVKKDMTWDWNHIGDLRLGQYTAKVTAIYDDGHRDVPLEGQTSFWIVPWRILLVIGAVAILIIAGIWSIIRKVIAVSKRMKR